MDVLAGDGDFREEVFVVEGKVRVFVVEGDYSLVGKEDFPAGCKVVSLGKARDSRVEVDLPG